MKIKAKTRSKKAANKKTNGKTVKVATAPLTSTHIEKIEAMQYGYYDAAIRENRARITALELKFQLAEIEHVRRQNNIRAEVVSLRQDIDSKVPRYEQLVRDLAKKYKMDPKHMVIDPDTGIIREEK